MATDNRPVFGMQYIHNNMQQQYFDWLIKLCDIAAYDLNLDTENSNTPRL